MIPTILALGLVITASTQLRAGGLPVGPGEMLLLGWLGLALVRQILCRPAALNPALLWVASFWLIMVVSLSIGTIAGLALEPFQDYGGMLRDAAAYFMVMSFGVMMAITLADPVERHRVCRSMAIIGSLSLLLQIGDGFGAIPVPGVDPWYYDRFRGWAENPNQLGFFALVVALISLHLAEQARTLTQTLTALLCTVPALMAGHLSHSDSFTIGLILSGAVFVTLKSVAWIRDTDVAPTLRGAAVVLGLMALPLAVVVTVPYGATALAGIERGSRQIYDDNGQGDTRLNLWAEALEKGVDSWLIGFGPGPHLTSKSFKRPPPSKFEAHNTPLDLFTQGGVVAVFAFAWISLSALTGVVRTGHPALAGLVAGLLVFSMFHYVLRQPIFWFGIVLCLLEAACPARTPASRIPLRDPGQPAFG